LTPEIQATDSTLSGYKANNSAEKKEMDGGKSKSRNAKKQITEKTWEIIERIWKGYVFKPKIDKSTD
jgi:hypothetical protein